MAENIILRNGELLSLRAKDVLKFILWIVAVLLVFGLGNSEFQKLFFNWAGPASFAAYMRLLLLGTFFFSLVVASVRVLKKASLFQDTLLIISFVSMTFLGLSFTGGLSSPLFNFLIFSLIFSGIILPFWGTVLISTVEAIIYASFILFQHFKLAGLPFLFLEKGQLFFLYQTVIYSILLLLAGLITGYFAEIFRQRNDSLLKALKELKETQAQLIQSEKMASIGILTSGITHELKNPITSILGFADLALKKSKAKVYDQELDELIQEIYLDSRHCREIILNLLDFSRTSGKGESFEKINISLILQNALRIIKHQLDIQNITVKENFSLQEINIYGVATQLQQVFLNILINARDAMPTGGVLEIQLISGTGTVAVSFKDTGAGMTPEVLERVFEPFFTTKEKGKGVGLGLSVSYGIILKHEGTIKINSQPQKGTEVLITLPVFKKNLNEKET